MNRRKPSMVKRRVLVKRGGLSGERESEPGGCQARFSGEQDAGEADPIRICAASLHPARAVLDGYRGIHRKP
jgi:hypothetical protein